MRTAVEVPAITSSFYVRSSCSASMSPFSSMLHHIRNYTISSENLSLPSHSKLQPMALSPSMFSSISLSCRRHEGAQHVTEDVMVLLPCRCFQRPCGFRASYRRCRGSYPRNVLEEDGVTHYGRKRSRTQPRRPADGRHFS